MEAGVVNLRILGVGVPTITSSSVHYSVSQPLSYLLMKTNTEDMNEFIDYWFSFVSNRAPETLTITRESVDEICNWVCEFTNGHMYLMVSFCHYFFSKSDLKAKIDNYVDYFTSGEFFLAMEDARRRCRLHISVLPIVNFCNFLFDRDAISFASNVSVLSKLGYLDETTNHFFSDYVLCCFQNHLIGPPPGSNKLSPFPDGYSLAEKRIIGGLRHMKETDFFANIGPENFVLAPSVEDAVSQRWSYYVITEFKNVFVCPQARTRPKKGRVDFLFNGQEKIAIEVALNGTRQVYVEKLDKFLSTEGVYKQWRNSFAIFNIVTDSMKRKDIRGIPKKCLKYLFEFNVQTNTLYRGDMVKPLLVSVSSYLRTPPPLGKD
jgi:hypothetical protein